MLSSIFAINGYSKPQTVEAASLTQSQIEQRRENPGLYQTGTTTLVSSWSELISSGKITISSGKLRVVDKTLAGDLVCGKVEGLTDLSSAFMNCSKLTTIDTFNLDTSNVINVYCMFDSCSSLISLDLSNFDTSDARDMWSMFANCTSLTTLDLRNFDTSQVTDMHEMFAGCSKLTSLNVSSFNTSNVKDMTCMFQGCSSLTSLNVSNFNTGNVVSMRSMFDSCSSLTSFSMGKFNTSKVTNMNCMFYNFSYLPVLDLSDFDTRNVTLMQGMFGSTSLGELILGKNFVITKKCSADGMFSKMFSHFLSDEKCQQLLELKTPEERVIKLCEYFNKSLDDLTIKEYNEYIIECSDCNIGKIVAPNMDSGAAAIILVAPVGMHYSMEDYDVMRMTKLTSSDNNMTLKLYSDKSEEQPSENVSTLDTTTLIIIIAVAGVVVISILGVVIIAIKKRKARRF